MEKYINVGKYQTIVWKMKTIFKESAYRIIKLFYENRNKQLHLREIARRLKLNESTVSSRLNELVKEDILAAERDANLRKFHVKKKAIAVLFPYYDYERLEKLPLLRKNAVKEYVKKLESKPLLMIVFGSTARGNFTKESDIDILEVFTRKTDTEEAKKHAEALTGMRLQLFQLTEAGFKRELIEKKDAVVQTALETGFPVFNQKYYYEIIYNE